MNRKRADGTWRIRRAHILAYELEHGPVPDGLELSHLCEVRRCIRVDHLEATTHQANMTYGTGAVGAQNRAKTHCAAGHPYDAANTYRTPDGHRNCRACNRLAVQAYNARRTACNLST